MSGDLFEMLDLWKRQAALATGLAAMAPVAGYVIANRMMRMTTEFGRPTAAGQREAERMVSEKMTAAFEGGAAASRVLGGMALVAGPLAAAGLMVEAGEAALKPVSLAVQANARRLSRRR